MTFVSEAGVTLDLTDASANKLSYIVMESSDEGKVNNIFGSGAKKTDDGKIIVQHGDLVALSLQAPREVVALNADAENKVFMQYAVGAKDVSNTINALLGIIPTNVQSYAHAALLLSKAKPDQFTADQLATMGFKGADMILRIGAMGDIGSEYEWMKLVTYEELNKPDNRQLFVWLVNHHNLHTITPPSALKELLRVAIDLKLLPWPSEAELLLRRPPPLPNDDMKAISALASFQQYQLGYASLCQYVPRGVQRQAAMFEEVRSLYAPLDGNSRAMRSRIKDAATAEFHCIGVIFMDTVSTTNEALEHLQRLAQSTCSAPAADSIRLFMRGGMRHLETKLVLFRSWIDQADLQALNVDDRISFILSKAADFASNGGVGITGITGGGAVGGTASGSTDTGTTDGRVAVGQTARVIQAANHGDNPIILQRIKERILDMLHTIREIFELLLLGIVSTTVGVASRPSTGLLHAIAWGYVDPTLIDPELSKLRTYTNTYMGQYLGEIMGERMVELKILSETAVLNLVLTGLAEALRGKDWGKVLDLINLLLIAATNHQYTSGSKRRTGKVPIAEIYLDPHYNEQLPRLVSTLFSGIGLQGTGEGSFRVILEDSNSVVFGFSNSGASCLAQILKATQQLLWGVLQEAGEQYMYCRAGSNLLAVVPALFLLPNGKQGPRATYDKETDMLKGVQLRAEQEEAYQDLNKTRDSNTGGAATMQAAIQINVGRSHKSSSDSYTDTVNRYAAVFNDPKHNSGFKARGAVYWLGPSQYDAKRMRDAWPHGTCVPYHVGEACSPGLGNVLCPAKHEHASGSAHTLPHGAPRTSEFNLKRRNRANTAPDQTGGDGGSGGRGGGKGKGGGGKAKGGKGKGKPKPDGKGNPKRGASGKGKGANKKPKPDAAAGAGASGGGRYHAAARMRKRGEISATPPQLTLACTLEVENVKETFNVTLASPDCLKIGSTCEKLCQLGFVSDMIPLECDTAGQCIPGSLAEGGLRGGIFTADEANAEHVRAMVCNFMSTTKWLQGATGGVANILMMQMATEEMITRGELKLKKKMKQGDEHDYLRTMKKGSTYAEDIFYNAFAQCTNTLVIAILVRTNEDDTGITEPRGMRFSPSAGSTPRCTIVIGALEGEHATLLVATPSEKLWTSWLHRDIGSTQCHVTAAAGAQVPKPRASRSDTPSRDMPAANGLQAPAATTRRGTRASSAMEASQVQQAVEASRAAADAEAAEVAASELAYAESCAAEQDMTAKEAACATQLHEAMQASESEASLLEASTRAYTESNLAAHTPEQAANYTQHSDAPSAARLAEADADAAEADAEGVMGMAASAREAEEAASYAEADAADAQVRAWSKSVPREESERFFAARCIQWWWLGELMNRRIIVHQRSYTHPRHLNVPPREITKAKLAQQAIRARFARAQPQAQPHEQHHAQSQARPQSQRQAVRQAQPQAEPQLQAQAHPAQAQVRPQPRPQAQPQAQLQCDVSDFEIRATQLASEEAAAWKALKILKAVDVAASLAMSAASASQEESQQAAVQTATASMHDGVSNLMAVQKAAAMERLSAASHAAQRAKDAKTAEMHASRRATAANINTATAAREAISRQVAARKQMLLLNQHETDKCAANLVEAQAHQAAQAAAFAASATALHHLSTRSSEGFARAEMQEQLTAKTLEAEQKRASCLGMYQEKITGNLERTAAASRDHADIKARLVFSCERAAKLKDSAFTNEVIAFNASYQQHIDQDERLRRIAAHDKALDLLQHAQHRNWTAIDELAKSELDHSLQAIHFDTNLQKLVRKQSAQVAWISYLASLRANSPDSPHTVSKTDRNGVTTVELSFCDALKKHQASLEDAEITQGIAEAANIRDIKCAAKRVTDANYLTRHKTGRLTAERRLHPLRDAKAPRAYSSSPASRAEEATVITNHTTDDDDEAGTSGAKITEGARHKRRSITDATPDTSARHAAKKPMQHKSHTAPSTQPKHHPHTRKRRRRKGIYPTAPASHAPRHCDGAEGDKSGNSPRWNGARQHGRWGSAIYKARAVADKASCMLSDLSLQARRHADQTNSWRVTGATQDELKARKDALRSVADAADVAAKEIVKLSKLVADRASCFNVNPPTSPPFETRRQYSNVWYASASCANNSGFTKVTGSNLIKVYPPQIKVDQFRQGESQSQTTVQSLQVRYKKIVFRATGSFSSCKVSLLLELCRKAHGCTPQQALRARHVSKPLRNDDTWAAAGLHHNDIVDISPRLFFIPTDSDDSDGADDKPPPSGPHPNRNPPAKPAGMPPGGRVNSCGKGAQGGRGGRGGRGSSGHTRMGNFYNITKSSVGPGRGHMGKGACRGRGSSRLNFSGGDTLHDKDDDNMYTPRPNFRGGGSPQPRYATRSTQSSKREGVGGDSEVPRANLVWRVGGKLHPAPTDDARADWSEGDLVPCPAKPTKPDPYGDVKVGDHWTGTNSTWRSRPIKLDELTFVQARDRGEWQIGQLLQGDQWQDRTLRGPSALLQTSGKAIDASECAGVYTLVPLAGPRHSKLTGPLKGTLIAYYSGQVIGGPFNKSNEGAGAAGNGAAKAGGRHLIFVEHLKNSHILIDGANEPAPFMPYMNDARSRANNTLIEPRGAVRAKKSIPAARLLTATCIGELGPSELLTNYGAWYWKMHGHSTTLPVASISTASSTASPAPVLTTQLGDSLHDPILVDIEPCARASTSTGRHNLNMTGDHSIADGKLCIQCGARSGLYTRCALCTAGDLPAGCGAHSLRIGGATDSLQQRWEPCTQCGSSTLSHNKRCQRCSPTDAKSSKAPNQPNQQPGQCNQCGAPSSGSRCAACTTDRTGVPTDVVAKKARHSGDRRVLHLFAGTHAGVCRAASSVGWTATEVDIKIDGTDLLNPANQDRYLSLVTSGTFQAVLIGIPCSSFSVALAADGHDHATLRSWGHPDGKPDLTGANLDKLTQHNVLVRFSISIAAAQLSTGGEIIIENPEDRSVLGSRAYWQARAHMPPLWSTSWLVRLLAQAEELGRPLKRICIPQCAFGPGPHGQLFQKWTGLLCSPGAARRLQWADTLTCTHETGHDKASGRQKDGSARSALTAQYPDPLCRALVYALTGFRTRRGNVTNIRELHTSGVPPPHRSTPRPAEPTGQSTETQSSIGSAAAVDATKTEAERVSMRKARFAPLTTSDAAALQQAANEWSALVDATSTETPQAPALFADAARGGHTTGDGHSLASAIPSELAADTQSAAVDEPSEDARQSETASSLGLEPCDLRPEPTEEHAITPPPTRRKTEAASTHPSDDGILDPEVVNGGGKVTQPSGELTTAYPSPPEPLTHCRLTTRTEGDSNKEETMDLICHETLPLDMDQTADSTQPKGYPRIAHSLYATGAAGTSGTTASTLVPVHFPSQHVVHDYSPASAMVYLPADSGFFGAATPAKERREAAVTAAESWLPHIDRGDAALFLAAEVDVDACADPTQEVDTAPAPSAIGRITVGRVAGRGPTNKQGWDLVYVGRNKASRKAYGALGNALANPFGMAAEHAESTAARDMCCNEHEKLLLNPLHSSAPQSEMLVTHDAWLTAASRRKIPEELFKLSERLVQGHNVHLVCHCRAAGEQRTKNTRCHADGIAAKAIKGAYSIVCAKARGVATSRKVATVYRLGVITVPVTSQPQLGEDEHAGSWYTTKQLATSSTNSADDYMRYKAACAAIAQADSSQQPTADGPSSMRTGVRNARAAKRGGNRSNSGPTARDRAVGMDKASATLKQLLAQACPDEPSTFTEFKQAMAGQVSLECLASIPAQLHDWQQPSAPADILARSFKHFAQVLPCAPTPLAPPDPPPLNGWWPDSIEDILTPKALLQINQWIAAAQTWHKAGGPRESRPASQAWGTDSVQPRARGRRWDLRGGPGKVREWQAADAATRQASTCINLEVAKTIFASCVDKEMLEFITEGVRFNDNLDDEVQVLLCPNLLSLYQDGGVHAAAAQADDMVEAGFIRVFENIPCIPLRIIPRGVVPKAGTDELRGIADQGAPRKELLTTDTKVPVRSLNTECRKGSWAHECKDTIENAAHNGAILRAMADTENLPVFEMSFDKSKFFHRLFYHTSALYQMGALIPSRASESCSIALEFVVSMGATPSSQVLQRFASMIVQAIYARMDALEATAMSPSTSWSDMMSARSTLHEDSYGTHARAYDILMYSDDIRLAAVGVDRTVLLLRAFHDVVGPDALNVPLSRIAKQQIGTSVKWLGCFTSAGLGIVWLPPDKIVRAASGLQEALDGTLEVGDYRRLLGFLVSIRFMSGGDNELLHHIFRPLRPGEELDSGPATLVIVDELMRPVLQRWQCIVSNLPGAAALAAVEPSPPLTGTLKHRIYTDAALQGTPSPGIGGFLYGRWFAIAIADRSGLELLDIPHLEALAAGVGILTFAEVLSGAAHVVIETDALATAVMLTNRARSPSMQVILDALLARPEYTALAPRLTCRHILGASNWAADAASRGYINILEATCAAMGIKTKRQPPSVAAEAFLADAIDRLATVRANTAPVVRAGANPLQASMDADNYHDHHTAFQGAICMIRNVITLQIDLLGVRHLRFNQVPCDEIESAKRSWLLLNNIGKFVGADLRERSARYSLVAVLATRCAWGREFRTQTDKQAIAACATWCNTNGAPYVNTKSFYRHKMRVGVWKAKSDMGGQQNTSNLALSVSTNETALSELPLLSGPLSWPVPPHHRSLSLPSVRSLIVGEGYVNPPAPTDVWGAPERYASDTEGERRRLKRRVGMLDCKESAAQLHAPIESQDANLATLAWGACNGRNDLPWWAASRIASMSDKVLPATVEPQHYLVANPANLVPSPKRARKRARSAPRDFHWEELPSGILSPAGYLGPKMPSRSDEDGERALLRRRVDMHSCRTSAFNLAEPEEVEPLPSWSAARVAAMKADTNACRAGASRARERTPSPERRVTAPQHTASRKRTTLRSRTPSPTTTKRAHGEPHAVSHTPPPQRNRQASPSPDRSRSVTPQHTPKQPAKSRGPTAIAAYTNAQCNTVPQLPTHLKPRAGAKAGTHPMLATARAQLMQLRCEELQADKTPGAIGCNNDMLEWMVETAMQGDTEAQPNNTKKQQASNWKAWKLFCAAFKIEPWRPDESELDAKGKQREHIIWASALVWIYARMKPAKGNFVKNGPDKGMPCPPKPQSALAILRGVRKEHLDRGISPPPLLTATRRMRELTHRYTEHIGPENCAPKRKAPLTHALICKLLRTQDSMPTGKRGAAWRWASHFGVSTKALYHTLAQTGFRKAEIAIPKGTKWGSMNISFANLTWIIDGKPVAAPTWKQLAGLRKGDYAVIIPPPSKADPYGMRWGNNPIYLPFNASTAINAGRALAQWELQAGILESDRRTTPLFCGPEGAGTALYQSTIVDIFHRMLKLIVGDEDAKMYSMHSWRSYLASALMAAGRTDAEIQLALRWASPEALRIYQVANAELYGQWLIDAERQELTGMRAIQVPRPTARPLPEHDHLVRNATLRAERMDLIARAGRADRSASNALENNEDEDAHDYDLDGW